MKGVPTCQTGTEVGFIWVRRIDLDAQRLFLETTTCWTRDAKGKELFINNRRTMPPCTPTAANRLHNGPSPPTYPTFPTAPAPNRTIYQFLLERTNDPDTSNSTRFANCKTSDGRPTCITGCGSRKITTLLPIYIFFYSFGKSNSNKFILLIQN
jgi:hypothetical protein